MREHFKTSGIWLILIWSGAFLLPATAEIDVATPPENHIWDRDGLFRGLPESEEEISRALKSLDDEFGMKVYLVLHSDVVSEKPGPFAMRCQDTWLGEKDEGLVLVLSTNGGVAGVVGYSQKLYNGHFIEEGIMPPLPYSDLQGIVQKGILKLMKEEDQLKMVSVFPLTVVDGLKEKLSRYQSRNKGKEKMVFMGWMGVVLLVGGLLIAVASRLMGTVDRRSRRTYRFPDFTVPQRLKVTNGGGKISLIDFETPPSFDGR